MFLMHHELDIPRNPEECKERLDEQDHDLMDAVLAVAEAIRDMASEPRLEGMEKRALLVGGFIRDVLLGWRPKDADLEVYGVSLEQLEKLLNELFEGNVFAVGKTFGVFKVMLGDGKELDIAIPRRESKTGAGHRGFSVQGDPTMSVEEASRRRDFTMNSIAVDPLTGELFDPYGGMKDIESHMLRVTDPERFQDDPLRVYRAVQFAARFDLVLETQSRELLREMIHQGVTDELPSERITEEIRKLLLKSDKPSIGFELARDLKLIDRDYPELLALIGTKQEPLWHPEGDVWIHTMMVLDEAAIIIRQTGRKFSDEEKLEVMLGCLCHDLGKPAATLMEDERIRSKDHEEAGEAPARALLNRWSFGSDIEMAVIHIVKQHLKPGMHQKALGEGKMSEDQYANAIRRLVKRIYPVSWRVLIAACEADWRGRSIPGADTEPYETGNLFIKTVLMSKLDEAPTKPLILGRDLIGLGLKPGPEFGRLIHAVEEERDEGRLKTHEEALEYLKTII